MLAPSFLSTLSLTWHSHILFYLACSSRSVLSREYQFNCSSFCCNMFAPYLIFSDSSLQLLLFYPLYVFSIVISTIWYNDIAKFGYVALGRSKFTGEKDSSQSNSPTLQNASHVKRPAGLGGL
ncbi:hypothetical protein S83_027987 [Arachis hypogaea]